MGASSQNAFGVSFLEASAVFLQHVRVDGVARFEAVDHRDRHEVLLTLAPSVYEE